MGYRWIEPNIDIGKDLAIKYHPAIARALERRGIFSESSADIFFNPRYERDSNDPFLLGDMECAVSRISKALSKSEKIALYCDYDVDGLSSGAILHTTLRTLGGDVCAYMNHREKEGYGINRDAIARLINKGAQLIITTDCGISNAAEIDYAAEMGIDVIITDHHALPAREEDIPRAYAIIHPLLRSDRYPCKELAGGGSAFKLAQALIRSDFSQIAALRNAARDGKGNAIDWRAYEKWLLDLVCLSTIGDCVPLTGENRMFVKFGLQVLAKTRRPGLQALVSKTRMRFTALDSTAVSFCIAPRINAASRMDHAQRAFDLLITESVDEAESIANQLDRLNYDRQKLTEKLMLSARDQLDNCNDGKKKVLVGFSEEWPLGMLGLVAGKLCDYYRKPVVLMTSGCGIISGAARSTPNFHITEAFSEISHVFERYGGHQAAGGFALKQHSTADEVRRLLEELTERRFSMSEHTDKELAIDSDISLSDCTWDFVSSIEQFKPHGIGNPKLRFRITAATILRISFVGQNKQHVRMTLVQGTSRKDCIGFSLASKAADYVPGDSLDAVCELDEHEWSGIKSIQVQIIDFKKSHEV